MEIIIGIIVFAALAYFIFVRKSATKTAESTAPYKLETPAPAEQVKEVVAETVAEAAPIVEAAPVVEAAPAKKTRKPRTPKAAPAEKPAKVVKAKAAAPKAKAPAKAPAAKKPAARTARSKKV